jgi:hypothetical protein
MNRKVFSFMCLIVILALTILGVTQARAVVTCTEDEIANFECYTSLPDGAYVVKAVKGDDGSFPVIDRAGNSVFKYTINCETKIEDVLALFETCDPPLVPIEASTSRVGSSWYFNVPGVGDTDTVTCKTYFGTGQMSFQTFEWRKFSSTSGSVKVTLRGLVEAARGPMLLKRSCNATNWEYGEIKLPACKALYTLAPSIVESKTITGILNGAQVQIELEIYRDPVTGCATKVRFMDLSGRWFIADPVTVQAQVAGDDTPETLIICSDTNANQKCPECQFTATGSPGWTYISSGGVTRRVCIGYYDPNVGCCDQAGCVK